MNTLRPLRALALAALLAPAAALAQNAACSLYASTYSDTLLYSTWQGEDSKFFTNEGSVPNLMFLLDNSGSMVNLPPDGPDTFKNSDGTWGGKGCNITYLNTRVYHSPCGTTVADGQPFNGAVKYSDVASVCNHMTSSQNTCGGGAMTCNGDKGFDPDFYCGDGTSCGGTTPNYFDWDQAFRDNDGWSDAAQGVSNNTNPTTAYGKHWTDFCNHFTDPDKTTCNTCMLSKGYYYDGSDIYYSGNFLNFFPPKFVIARKVLKDAMMTNARVRFGITTFNDDSGGILTQPINPACHFSYPPNGSQFDSNRKSMVTSVNKLAFDNWTPLAETLFNIGQYYHTQSLSWFGDQSWSSGGYRKKSGTDSFDAQSGDNESICFPCQQSSVVIITDGYPTQDQQIPSTGTAPDLSWANTAGNYAGSSSRFNVAGISCSDGIVNRCTRDIDPDTGFPYLLPKVAWYVHHVDMRDNNEGMCSLSNTTQKMTGKQVINVYTIGFGTDPNADQLLADAAYRSTSNADNDVGGGFFVPAQGADQLQSALAQVISDINTRATTFGVASVSSLQASAGESVFLPRFNPSRSAHWNGHLYRFQILSEFVAGCQPTVAPSPLDPNDFDCDRKCTSVFLVDSTSTTAAPVFIQEDSSGNFVRDSPVNKAPCGPSNLCGVGNCGVASSTPAVPYWDAGARLASTSWSSRKVYTAVDSNNDGVIDASDGLVQLSSSLSATDLAKLLPYFPVYTSDPVGKPTYCQTLVTQLQAAGNTALATSVVNDLTAGNFGVCIQTFVDFLLGEDIFDENSNGSYTDDRPYKLGDIFHSSPVDVHPPDYSYSVLCAAGLDNQCLVSLFLTSTPIAPSSATPANANAYDDFADAYKSRNHIVVVGANDGMLHAFDAGASTGAAPGTGNELWAFVPPDMLAKLPMFAGVQHQYFVDGTAMVRDMWADGTRNGKFPQGALDDTKQAGEFHTVAVVGERRGGTHYFALDLTDATSAGTQPKFLWIYPQPNSPEELRFGETYDEFLPTPPPIGPVRVNDGVTYAGTQQLNGTPFHEKWITFLSGGYDPYYAKGRGVHMVDMWTGKEVFDFSSKPANTTASASFAVEADQCGANGDPRCHLQFPVSAPVTMVAWGNGSRNTTSDHNGYFFDTATFGDIGGQIWTLRFHTPGQDTSGDGLVDNWYGARLAKVGSSANLDLCGTQPIFFAAADVPLTSSTGLLRVLLGTGDRYNALASNGGSCRFDNIRQCCRLGCDVHEHDTTFEVDNELGQQKYHLHPKSCDPQPGAWKDTYASNSGACTQTLNKVDFTLNCPSSVVLANTANQQSIVCSGAAGVFGCTTTDDTAADSTDTDTSSTTGATVPVPYNWYLSVRAFADDPTTHPVFNTAADAITYDQHFYWVGGDSGSGPSGSAGLVLIDGSVNTQPATVASSNGDGFGIYYNRATATDSVTNTSFPVIYSDERTASGSAVYGGCAYWNSLVPAAPTSTGGNTGGTCSVSPCSAGASRVAYFYGANPATGGLCLADASGTTQVRAIGTGSLVPPPAPQLTVFVDKYGRVMTAMTSTTVGQSPKTSGAGAVQDPFSLVDQLTVGRGTHACRHGTTPGVPPSSAACQ